MRIIAISDTHGKHRLLKIPEGDIIIHAGDFCHYGSEEQVLDFLKWFSQLDFETSILIAGNHDFMAYEQATFFKKILPPNITYLEDSGTQVEGFNIWGSPVQPDLIGWAFGKERGNAMNKHWDQIPKDTHILVTHTPPYGILDETGTRQAIGCENLFLKLEKLSQLKVHIFGHVHRSYGHEKMANIDFINAASFNSRKTTLNDPIVIDI